MNLYQWDNKTLVQSVVDVKAHPDMGAIFVCKRQLLAPISVK